MRMDPKRNKIRGLIKAQYVEMRVAQDSYEAGFQKEAVSWEQRCYRAEAAYNHLLFATATFINKLERELQLPVSSFSDES